MRDTLSESLKKLQFNKNHHKRMMAILMILSLIVTTDVFWTLRQTGITMAGDATCGIEEHSHSEECSQSVLICGLSEEVHIHDDSCYTTQLIEAQEENVLVCDLTEIPHTHTEGCYELRHVDGYDEQTLLCENTEETHVHEETCYSITHVEGYDEEVLICTLVSEPHEHVDACYAMKVIEAHEEQVLTCTLSEEAHVHTDTCYEQQLQCEKEEHVHSIECYADETADVETQLDWQEMFSGMVTGNLANDLVTVAKSQIGYRESERNFIIDDAGNRAGYTRYGAWYGSPYGDWSAMFVSFCLNYAGSSSGETPYNTGAGSMASAWSSLNKYAEAGTYSPIRGDLVFFGSTVGIVTEVYGNTIHVVKGDVEDEVISTEMLMTDSTITGWGLTSGTMEETPQEDEIIPDESVPEESIPEETEAQEQETAGNKITMADVLLMDTSAGPVVCVSVGAASDAEAAASVIATFALARETTGTDIKDYAEANGGTFTLTIVDADNQSLPTDENGNYIATAGQAYKLALGIDLPNGIASGTYTYQLPDGLTVKAGSGTLTVTSDGKSVDIGTWSIDENGLITFVFNESANNYSEVTISASMEFSFEESDSAIEFDGSIKVTVNPPEAEVVYTKITKGGNGAQTDENGNLVLDENGNYIKVTEDFDRIRWSVSIYGGNGSNIIGQTITDTITTGDTHYYSDEDMALGLTFGYTDPDTGKWHSWTVYPGEDTGLTWTEDGWTYTMPETCPHCGIALSNEGTYLINYYSTVQNEDEGHIKYRNNITTDGAEAVGDVSQTITAENVGIIKEGAFNGTDGNFHWSITASIPGYSGEGRYNAWTIWDSSKVVNNSWTTQILLEKYYDSITNFTITYGGNTYTVYPIDTAPADAQFVYKIAMSADGSGLTIHLGMKCDCTEDTCMNWKTDGCNHNYTFKGTGYCTCWSLTEDAVVQINYARDGSDLIDEYGGQSLWYYNAVTLTKYQKDETGEKEYVSETADTDKDQVPIPGIFKKELIDDPDELNGYTASYEITVNESMLDLSQWKPLTIEDQMSDTLVYIPGTMEITATSTDGIVRTLTVDEDYTIQYDASSHTITLEILTPGAEMYTLHYDAQIILETGQTQVSYDNYANVSLFGKSFEDDVGEKYLTDFVITAKSYSVKVAKTEGDSGTGAALAGAEFGLYAANGELIISGVTDENGNLTFSTNVAEGIILQEHVLYYIQEIQAPAGYRTEDTKHWFCFCNSTEATCTTCTEVMSGQTAFRIPYEEIGTVDAVNYIAHYKLPSTGGPGIYPYILWGIVLVAIPLVYGYMLRRKRERRGVR